MQKHSGNRVRVESWLTFPVGKQATVVEKVTVRRADGTFLPATNYRGSVLRIK